MTKGSIFHWERWRQALLLAAFFAILTLNAGAATHTVNMQNFQFVPRNLTINVGDTVRWVNLDSTGHDTVSGTNGVPSGVWRSPLFGQGQSFSFTFSSVAPGGYGYYCTPHVFTFGMRGTITVVAPNQPPTVTITSPANGATLVAGQNIQIEASASDPDGTVTRVDFFVNGSPVGSATSAPFRFTLNNVGAGSYQLSAVAVDNGGASSAPSVVNVSVEAGNVPPSVTITNPINGQTFLLGTNISVQAIASDPDGTVQQVEFFLNDASVGVITSAPYSVLLTNLGLGDYTLRAVARDNQAATTPATVVFSVVEAPQPPTILQPPQSQVALAGSTVSFMVSASGTGPLSYQWLFNGAPLPAATNSTIVLTNVQLAQAGVYSVTVSNVFGVVTSEGATLRINIQPLVSIVSPANDSTFVAQSDIPLVAEATDPDGRITGVEFLLSTNAFATNSIAVLTNAPFSFVLSNAMPGTYILLARAVDDLGAEVESAQVRFFVRNAPQLIRSPSDESLAPGTEIQLEAVIDPLGAAVTNVLFFAGPDLIGQDATSPYTATWSTNRLGDFRLLAVSLDASGQAATSAPVALRISTPERTRPSITITNSPANFSRLLSAQALVAGTARDDSSLDRVEYQVNGGPPQVISSNIASPSASWSVLVTNLSPGINTLRFRSFDLRTNASLDAVRYFTYVLLDTLDVEVEPGGTVTPEINGRQLEIGKAYNLTARSNPGYVFAGWGGVTNGVTNVVTPKLTFLMQPHLKLVARFATNRFTEMAAAYSGLFLDTNAVSPETSGKVALQVTKTGSFTGKLGMSGASYPFRGQLNGLGNASLPVLRRTLRPVVLNLQFDVGHEQFVGWVTNAVGTNGMTVVSQLLATKSIPPTADQPGNRSFDLTLESGAGNVGNGTMTVALNGMIQIRGVFLSETKFTAGSALQQGGMIPLYVPLNQGTEAMIGWVLAGAGPEPWVGNLFWAKSGADAVSLRFTSTE